MTEDEDRRSALEAAIDADPTRPDPYLVLADWLQERGDPRGELIARSQYKDAAGKAACATLQKSLGPGEPRYGWATWFCGFVQKFRTIVDEDDQRWCREFVEHPSLRHVTEATFELGGSEYDDRQWLIALISERPRMSWRTLSINSYLRGGNDPPCGDLDLGPLWTVLPRIETVYAHARYLTPGSLRSDTLRALSLDGEVSVEHLQPLLEGSAPALRSLTLEDVDAGIGSALAGSALAPQLEQLSLPALDPNAQQVIRERIPCATFRPAFDGDRYEQIGE